MRKRIPVSGPRQPLQNPFSALDLQGLPDPAPPEPASGTTDKPPRRHRIVLRRETAQRAGRPVIVVSRLPTHLAPPEIDNLCRDARKALGCGGTVREREIELQGDQPEKVRRHFEAQGFQVAGP